MSLACTLNTGAAICRLALLPANALRPALGAHPFAPRASSFEQIAPDGSQTREDRARANMRSRADQAAQDAAAAAKRANERSPRAFATTVPASLERK